MQAHCSYLFLSFELQFYVCVVPIRQLLVLINGRYTFADRPPAARRTKMCVYVEHIVELFAEDQLSLFGVFMCVESVLCHVNLFVNRSECKKVLEENLAQV